MLRRAGELASQGPLKVEIGSGPRKGAQGWLTVDQHEGCDLPWNLMEGLPFPTASVQILYSSHVLEHFSFEEGQRLLAECHRVLMPGGVLSVCVPNAGLYIRAYAEGKDLDEQRYFGGSAAYPALSKIDYINYVAYMGGEHRCLFDTENLPLVLARAGFKNARLRGFDPELDRQDRDFESIYAVAEK